MRLTRRIVAIAAAVTCALALAACGKAVVAHVKASDTVHSALTSVLNAPTTQFVVTAQDLPGQAALADGNFSVVVTASHLAGGAPDSMAGKALDVSIDYESNALVDLRAIGGSMYCRMDLKSIEGLAGSGCRSRPNRRLSTSTPRVPASGSSTISSSATGSASRPSTLKTLEQQLAPQVPGAVSSISGVQNASGLGLQITNSWEQSVRTWLSIHQTSSNRVRAHAPPPQLCRVSCAGVGKALGELRERAVSVAVLAGDRQDPRRSLAACKPVGRKRGRDQGAVPHPELRRLPFRRHLSSGDDRSGSERRDDGDRVRTSPRSSRRSPARSARPSAPASCARSEETTRRDRDIRFHG